MQALLTAFFRSTIDKPLRSALLILILLGTALYQAQNFKLDASADSLILEDDADLAYYRELSKRYGSDEFIVVAYSPEGNLFSDEVLAELQKLRDELEALPSIKAATSLLDVPLVDSPRMSLGEIQEEVRTLTHPETDREMARAEFRDSPLYKNLLTDPEATTTAIQLTLKSDSEAAALLNRREELRAQERESSLNADEQDELSRVSREYAQRSALRQEQQQQTIADVRAVMAKYGGQAQLHLGGLPMIASDMIDFVRADIKLFSLLVGGFLLILLAIAFRQVRWVLVPLSICAIVSLTMVGMLGLMSWPVTVVSSNFTSLTLIITLALVVHLVVRYRELQNEQPHAEQSVLLKETLRSKFAPSVYTTATTVVSFGSLIIADIRPVIDFGQMMVWAVVFAFVLSFILFPTLLSGLKPKGSGASGEDFTARITESFAGLIAQRGNKVLFFYFAMIVMAAIGISRLGVENRFIDYFKSSTEIYQGMVLIDKKLGGTTPVDVIIDAPASFFEEVEASDEDDEFLDDFEDDFADDFGDDFADESEGSGLSGSSYWYNVFELERVAEIHNYLESLDETGKVLSMASTMGLIKQLNGDEALDNFTLAVMHGRLPDDIKAQLFDPYMSEDGNQVRFSIRVIDSDKNLRRDELLKKMRRELVEKFDLEPEQLKIAGALVLYNNVLQSLFESQILTLSAVFVAIFFMLWMLFGSARLAIIGVLPTVFAASMILGLMGWMDIPLDIMTITIAAIVIGIGVDNTIHYTHRFQEEIQRQPDAWTAMRRTHGSVGRAIYLTSIIVTLGFSILGLSNFIPIVYFGLFTGLAMILALIANLTLLPLLLVKTSGKA